MFRFWAGATASLLVGLFGVSGVSAEGLGSTITPRGSSQPATEIVFAEVNFSSRNGPANLWDQAARIGLANAGESAGNAPSLAFVDFATTSPFGVGWSPMNSVIGATSPRAARLTDSSTAVGTYFGTFELLSTRGIIGSPGGSGFASPMGGAATMR